MSIKPPLPSDFLTGSSKLATRRRVIPNTLKKASQKDLASASSRDSCSHSLEKALARVLISFHESGIFSLGCFYGWLKVYTAAIYCAV